MGSIAIKKAIEQDKICIVKIRNSFQAADRDLELIEYTGESLLEIRDKHFPIDVDVVVCMNGEILSDDDIAITIPIKGDVITFTAKMGSDVLRIIVGVILVIIGILLYSTPVGSYLIIAGIGLIIGGVVGLLFPPKKPLIPQSGSEYDSSQVYGWNPQTIQQQGLSIPRMYGVNKLYGNIISAYIENENNKQYLNSLLCLGMGQIQRLFDFKINDQPIANLQGVDIYARYGNINQDAIPNFSDTKVEYPTSVKVVNGTPYVYTTVGNAFDGLEVDITFPSGLWYANDNGGLDAYSVNLRIEISLAGQNNWQVITHRAVTYTTGQPTHWSSGYWGEDGWRERLAGSTDTDAHYEGEPDRGVGWFEGKKCIWHWVESTLQIINQTYDYITVSAAQTSAIRRTYFTSGFAAGQYDIRITNLIADQTSSRYGDDMYLSSVREVTKDDFEYPRHILTGIRALATDQLSGSLKFTCLSEGHYIRVYNGSAWSIAYNNNPAWVAYDILTQPVFYDAWHKDQKIETAGRYIRPTTLNSRLYECTTAGITGSTEPTWPTTIGATVNDGTAVWTCRAGAAYDGVVRFDGYIPTLINAAKWKEWADYCDDLVPDGKGGQEKRITFNGVFDAGASVWEAVMQVCQAGRAVPIWTGTELTVFVDKPADPVQMFTIGNICQDSFEEAFLPMADRASEIDIDFINSEKDYTRDVATIFNPNINSDFGKSQIQMFGLTKPSEVWRAGQRLLAYNQYLERVVAFMAFADAIASTVGDVVLVQHDVPQWGFVGGRVVSATSNTVTIDKEVVIEASKTYMIVIRLSDDTRASKTITNSPGTYSTLTLATAFTTIPSKYDIYSFGEQNIETKPFRITDIQPSQDLQFKISAIEYNATIYNTDTGTPALPTINYSALTPYPAVSNIVLDELLVRGKDGSINDAIDIYFTKPVGDYRHVEIWYDNGGGYKYAGNCNIEYFRLDNAEVNKTYKIAIVTVNNAGAKDSIKNAPKAEIYTLGKLDPPSNITGFTVQAIYDSLEFNWAHIPDADLWGYEIRVGADWNTGVVVSGAGVSQNIYIWRPTITGTLNFWIKAIDTSSIYSVTATQANIIIQPPSAVTGLRQQVVDNNVLLKWSEVQGTFPIDYFEIRKGDVYSTAAILGTVKGTFTTIFEIQSGTYKYWITAFDTAGLAGASNSLSASVSQPPDFQLKANWDDDFTGTKTNIIYDSEDDKHYACVNTTETWTDHFVNNSNTTIQDFIDDGFTYLMQPVLTTANYEKVFDYGATIPGTMITAALDYIYLLGTLTITPTISISNTSATGPWTDYAGVWQVFGNNFRWVKINLAFTGTGQNIAALNNLNLRLSIKLQNDGGMDTITVANSGKVVNFTKAFADVDSITVTPQGTAARYAIYDFVDAPNPTQFTAYLFDSGGTKITGNFSWAAKGY